MCARLAQILSDEFALSLNSSAQVAYAVHAILLHFSYAAMWRLVQSGQILVNLNPVSCTVEQNSTNNGLA